MSNETPTTTETRLVYTPGFPFEVTFTKWLDDDPETLTTPAPLEGTKGVLTFFGHDVEDVVFTTDELANDGQVAYAVDAAEMPDRQDVAWYFVVDIVDAVTGAKLERLVDDGHLLFDTRGP